jgi:polyphosphate kinase 2 (PPK2 family)
MLELIDLTRRLSKAESRGRLPGLRRRLLQLQQACWSAAIPSVLVVEGWDAAGKGDIVRKLTERMEPRGYDVHYLSDEPRTYELGMPWMWRFWLAAPAHGKMAIFDRSWYRRALVERVGKKASELSWHQKLRDVTDFERTLTDEGCVLIKLFLHISKKEQKKRYRKAAQDPALQWKLDEKGAIRPGKYKDYLPALEEMLAHTDVASNPWTILAATHRRYARVTAFETLVARLEEALVARGHELPEPWVESEKPRPEEAQEEAK